MVTCVTISEIPSFKLKIKSSLWLLAGYSFVSRYNQTFPGISTNQI